MFGFYRDIMSEEPNVERVLQFVLRLYGIKYKDRKTFNSQLTGLKRTLSRNGDRAISQSNQLLRQISSEFPLNGELPLDSQDKGRLKKILNSFAKDVEGIISCPTSLFALAQRVDRLRQEFNSTVREMDGQFLPGFGPIHAGEVSLPELHHLGDFFRKLRKAQEAPQQLDCLHKKVNQVAITTSLTFYMTTQTR